MQLLLGASQIGLNQELQLFCQGFQQLQENQFKYELDYCRCSSLEKQ